MPEGVPIYAAPENWTGPCPECGDPATSRFVLYDAPPPEPPEPPEPDDRKPIGEAYVHAGTREDCVRPPEFAAALRSLNPQP